ncbi:MAG: MaoC family dehydratase N-terminal domain-containing protein [Anaerolineae bacterium]|nr:MaoC family dehydratase N-terminal domain-containing protein [Anaerolineae bacterium]
MTELTRPRGRYFEEFEIGDRVETATRTITETDVMVFAALSGDYNPLHTDAEFAKGTLFGERIAHGLLGLSIASGLASQLGFVEGTAEAFIGLEWKFRAPIKFGDTVRVQAKVRQKKAMGRLGGGFITFDVKLLNQRDETVQKGAWTVLIKSAP